MAQLLINENAFGGTKIDLNGNILSLTLGNSLSASVGISNSVYVGAKTQFIAGVNTNITLGPTASYTFGDIISTTFGWSWIWAPINNTTYDVATRWGTVRNRVVGGVTDTAYAARIIEDAQGFNIGVAVLGSYILLVGLTLLGMQFPPFTMQDHDDNGEAELGATSFNGANLTALLGDTLIVIFLAYRQWIMTTKYRDELRMFEPVTNMDLTFAGINCEVYTVPGPNPTPHNNAKTALYMRPYPGTIIPAPPPPPKLNPYIPFGLGNYLTNLNLALPQQRGLYLMDNPADAIPDIELLTTSGPGFVPFSQIYMNAMNLSIGVGPMNAPDVYLTEWKEVSNEKARLDATGPNISLDTIKNSVTIRNMPLVTNTNTITVDLVGTTIKRLTGSIELSVGAPGVGSSLTLDALFGATLSTGVGGSIAIDYAGDTTIKSAGLDVAKFSATTGVQLSVIPTTLDLNPKKFSISGPFFLFN